MLNGRLLIFIIRHGRTALNVQKVFRGHLDGPLDDVGKDQGCTSSAEVRQKVL